MAKCDICGKGPMFGHNVSHSNKKTRAVWKPNIQVKKVKVNGVTKRVHICTKCLKAGKLDLIAKV